MAATLSRARIGQENGPPQNGFELPRPPWRPDWAKLPKAGEASGGGGRLLIRYMARF